MKIQENEIASIESFGMLDGKQVNLVRTKGGLNLATIKSGGSETVLGAASHQAILCYTIEQRFPSFQPMLMKSDTGPKLEAVSHSHFLSDDLRKSGHDIYSVQDGAQIDFFLTNQYLKVGTVRTEIKGDTLMVKSLDANDYYKNGAAIVCAVSEKALTIGIKKVKLA